MRLHEWRSKQLMAEQGMPIPKGELAGSPEAARQIAEGLGVPVVVKAQVLVGGRGKAGGIRRAGTPAEAGAMAEELLASEVRGLAVDQVLVEEAVEIREELYVGAVVDRAARRVVVIASSEGGVEIEEVARETPEAIERVVIDPFLGLRPHQSLALANGIGLERDLRRSFTAIVGAVYGAFQACDAMLAEVNPLAVTADGDLVGVDGKIVVDDSALFRHESLERLRDERETSVEREAREAGLSYVELGGEIGCMVNGAGLAMATMDVVQRFGGDVANFLDIRGGARAERVAAALRLIVDDSKVKVVLINVFGGITRCDEVAQGIVAALDEIELQVPLVVRLAGTNAAQGRELLASADRDVIGAETLVEAARKAVAVAKGEGVDAWRS